jgi:phage terminase small subunit
MPVLKNARYERFCQMIMAGESKKNAAILAGFTPKSASVQAWKLYKLPEVVSRITELEKRYSHKLQKQIMSVTERKERLSEFAKANLVDFLDENGDPELDESIKGHGAVAEYNVKTRTITVGDNPIKEVTKTIKLRDPIASIDLLNKMDKLYSEGSQVNIDNRKIEITVVSEKAKELTEAIMQGARTEG